MLWYGLEPETRTISELLPPPGCAAATAGPLGVPLPLPTPGCAAATAEMAIDVAPASGEPHGMVRDVLVDKLTPAEGVREE